MNRIYVAALAMLGMLGIRPAHAGPPLPVYPIKPLTINVCRTVGCDTQDVVSAWRSALNIAHYSHTMVTIQIADGTWPLSDQLYTSDPAASRISIIGDVANQAAVILTSTVSKGNNLGGIVISSGATLGYVDGVTITAPTDGTGAVLAMTAAGTTWNPQSYGSGIAATNGSTVNVGPHVTVSNFYYSLFADKGGRINAGGDILVNGGDVNGIARHGSMLHCEGCTATRASDITPAQVASGGTLGCNFTAEADSTFDVSGSTVNGSAIGGICVLSGSGGWAHNVTGTGGINGKTGAGVWAVESSFVEADGSNFAGYNFGVYATSRAGVSLNGGTVSSSGTDGLQADGGNIYAGSTAVTGSTQYAFHSLHGGVLFGYGSLAKASGNTLGVQAVEIPSACTSATTNCVAPSLLYLN